MFYKHIMTANWCQEFGVKSVIFSWQNAMKFLPWFSYRPLSIGYITGSFYTHTH